MPSSLGGGEGGLWPFHSGWVTAARADYHGAGHLILPPPSSPLPTQPRYVVLNRPYALLQWIKGAVIPEKYVLMSEPDHVWLKPMPNLMTGTT